MFTLFIVGCIAYMCYNTFKTNPKFKDIEE